MLGIWGLNLDDMPAIVLAVVSLVLLEGLLSADNALVLAVMVRHLPKDQQRRALRYGIWGAFVFRLIAVVFASMLLQFWQLKVAGGLYLLYLAIKHLAFGEHDEPAPADDALAGDDDAAAEAAAKPKGSGFWTTVINVEIADVAFSIDSILAAVAMAEGLPARLQANGMLRLSIIYVGGILGIIMMRAVAGVFLVLLDRFKGLAAGAYYLVGWIGVKLVESGCYQALHPIQGASKPAWHDGVPPWAFHIPEMPDWLFWAVMALIVVASLLYRPRGGHGQGHVDPSRPGSPDDARPEVKLPGAGAP